MELTDLEIEIVKILTPLIDNPNAPDEYGETAIHAAARMRYTKVVKFFASSMPMLRINVKILLFICQVTKYGYKDNVQILTKIANA